MPPSPAELEIVAGPASAGALPSPPEGGGSAGDSESAARDETAAARRSADAASAGAAASARTFPPTAAARARSAVLRPYKPLRSIAIDATLPAGDAPGEKQAAPDGGRPWASDPRLMGGWGWQDFRWLPTLLCHRPLYFEEVNLERHGYTTSSCLQPVISGAHFFAVIPALPYKMAVDPPRSCISTLGYYRPGSRAPRRWHGLPLEAGAVTAETAAAAGLILLFP